MYLINASHFEKMFLRVLVCTAIQAKTNCTINSYQFKRNSISSKEILSESKQIGPVQKNSTSSNQIVPVQNKSSDSKQYCTNSKEIVSVQKRIEIQITTELQHKIVGWRHE